MEKEGARRVIVPTRGAAARRHVMLRFMLDTNVSIRVLRDRPPVIRQRLTDCADELCISTVVLMELLHGATRSSRPVETRRAVDRMASRLQVLAFDEAAATHAADLIATLRRSGQMTGGYDVQIAGHARSRGLQIVTSNLSEFRRVDGLMSEDWLEQ